MRLMKKYYDILKDLREDRDLDQKNRSKGYGNRYKLLRQVRKRRAPAAY